MDLLEYQPDRIFCFCSTVLPIGSMALLKARLPLKIGLIWPDTLFNLQVCNLHAPALYDGVSCYGEHGVELFSQLGYKNVVWVPLGADTNFHGSPTIPNLDDLKTDVCFVGGWRPEREQAMLEIVSAFPAISIEIHGPNWIENAGAKIKSYCSGKTLLGAAYSQACRRSRININVIDDTNYPAANMRFFELPMAGVLQLSSDCPEMRSVFRHREHMLYYSDNQDMIQQIGWVLEHPQESHQIRENGHRLAHAGHSYRHRAEAIVQQFAV